MQNFFAAICKMCNLNYINLDTWQWNSGGCCPLAVLIVTDLINRNTWTQLKRMQYKTNSSSTLTDITCAHTHARDLFAFRFTSLFCVSTVHRVDLNVISIDSIFMISIQTCTEVMCTLFITTLYVNNLCLWTFSLAVTVILYMWTVPFLSCLPGL